MNSLWIESREQVAALFRQRRHVPTTEVSKSSSSRAHSEGMGEVIQLFERERYCRAKGCRRVDCDRHCWSCSADHDSSDFGENTFCKACEIELSTDDDVDLTGFWDPPEQAAPRRRLRVPIDDLLREVGAQWLKDQVDDG